MEFVDYKCLESLLIEGEELIVTEGFKDTAFKIIKGIFIFISRVIEKIIVMIKRVLGALGVLKDPNYNKKLYMENRKNVVEIDKVVSDAHSELHGYCKQITDIITTDYDEGHMLYFMKQLDMLPSDTDGVIDKCNKAIEKMNGKTVYFDILTLKQTLKEDQSKLEKLKSDIDKKIQKMQNPEKYEDKKMLNIMTIVSKEVNRVYPVYMKMMTEFNKCVSKITIDWRTVKKYEGAIGVPLSMLAEKDYR